MKNICTAETARALKAAGFPQPEPEAGQVWYNEQGQPYFCLPADHFVDEYGSPEYQHPPIFAPTAADILRELWFRYSLRFAANGEWIVLEVTSLNNMAGDVIAKHVNPVEVCAAAWLATNKKDIEK